MRMTMAVVSLWLRASAQPDEVAAFHGIPPDDVIYRFMGFRILGSIVEVSG
jgi:hypothetical protein